MTYKSKYEQCYVIDSVYGVPEEIVEAMSEIWCEREFGNDNYYCRLDMKDPEGEDPNEDIIRAWLFTEGFTKDDKILLHYWW